MWLAEKRKGGGVSVNTAELAPALEAVRRNPVRELEQARRKLEEWSEALRTIDELLTHPDVSDIDRVALGFERVTASACAIACANLITACEEEMRRQAKRLRDSWGWLL